MTDQAHDITSLPAPTKSLFKKVAKRTALAAVAVTVVAAIYVKLTQSDSETVNIGTSTS